MVARDAQDEVDFAEVVERSERLTRVLGDGSRLLPDFEVLMLDLFSAFVKLNVKIRDAAEVRGSARLRAAIVEELTRSASFAETHRVTALRPEASGFATLRVAEGVLERLRRRELLSPAELEGLWRLAAEEEAEARAHDRVEAARELAEAREDAADALREAEEEASDEAAAAAARAEALDAALERAVDGIPRGVWNELGDQTGNTGDALSDAAQAGAAGAGQGGGPGDGGDAVDALALQAELADMPGMKRLIRLLGALREEARAARRKRVPRARTEVYGVEPGRDLERLLPVELVALRHPTLKTEFRRRYAESALLGYFMRGDEELGQGPAIFLLDVSGSMAGTKVVWAKAVVLTLGDIARRARRRVTVICFASGSARQRFDLAVPRRGQPTLRFDPTGLMGLAKLGVGGGTDFDAPLRDAMEIIASERVFRRADVVIVTDGEAQMAPERIRAVRDFAREHETRFLGVLVDVAEHQAQTLEGVCDDLVRVRELTGESARKVFSRF
ncbi:MAG: VWA domain-containing protein [Deltaproteobacteria bacterium]|nr:MAG: VWA domain-containing protein [Deltaproteobacteria bacterium]